MRRSSRDRYTRLAGERGLEKHRLLNTNQRSEDERQTPGYRDSSGWEEVEGGDRHRIARAKEEETGKTTRAAESSGTGKNQEEEQKKQ